MNPHNNTRFLNNYDYCYLESMHWLFATKLIRPETIITGLSYGLEAIDCLYLNRPSLSFCMHSQDLFYDTHHIVNILKNDSEHVVKNCIFALGYYSFHYDLSRTMFKQRCLNIYYPLFKTTHNMYADDNQKSEALKRVWDSEFANTYHAYFRDNPQYFGNFMIRETTSNAVVAQGGWDSISDKERDAYAQNRATLQNKHIQHTDTLKENVELFYKICQVLVHSDINIYVMIMPFTTEYLKYIDKRYREIIYGILNELPFVINYIDFNDDCIMHTEDFLDQDHLTAAGARKLSGIINSIIV